VPLEGYKGLFFQNPLFLKKMTNIPQKALLRDIQGSFFKRHFFSKMSPAYPSQGTFKGHRDF